MVEVALDVTIDDRLTDRGGVERVQRWRCPHLLHLFTRISGKFHTKSVYPRFSEEFSVPAIRALDKLEDILASSENFLQRMHERGNDPFTNKQLVRLFSPSEAAEMVGRDRTTLARAEADLG